MANAASALATLQLLSQLAPIPCRTDIVTAAQRHFFKLARAIEVGVFEGAFAAHNLKTWTGDYWLVDAWELGSNVVDKSNLALPFSSRATATLDERTYAAALNNTAFARNRTHVKRAYSTNAAASFPDGYFDWIYVDALHTRAAVLDDLRAWWPKLRPGGLLSGDDYGDETDVEYLREQRFRRHQSRHYLSKGFTTLAHVKHRWGVANATQEFAKEVSAVLQITYLSDCYLWPA
jgi:SAM-dependent methyltransferase